MEHLRGAKHLVGMRDKRGLTLTAALTSSFLIGLACSGSPVSPSTTVVATKPPVMGDYPLAPGTYRVSSMEPLSVSFTVGDGWHGQDWFLFNENRQTHLGFTRVVNLFADSCHWKDNATEPPIGPTVDDLIAAISSHSERTPTAPEQVNVGGRAGKAIEWSVPADVDFAKCDDGIYASWTMSTWRGDVLGVRSDWARSQVDRIYALDVGGTRLVMEENWIPGTTDAERAAMHAIVESLTISD